MPGEQSLCRQARASATKRGVGIIGLTVDIHEQGASGKLRLDIGNVGGDLLVVSLVGRQSVVGLHRVLL